MPLQFILTGGERHVLSQAESLLAPFNFDAVIADKGYDSDPLRELLVAKQVEVVIPSRRYRKQQRDYDRRRYRERNIVERTINIIKWYRRMSTRTRYWDWGEGGLSESEIAGLLLRGFDAICVVFLDQHLPWLRNPLSQARFRLIRYVGS